MSFLDNLESNLKALEAREEKDAAKIQEERHRREAERTAALRRAPHAEALRSSAFTSNLLTECRIQSRPLRVLVRFTWIGDVLRLDAGDKRLELVPTPDGILAVSSRGAVTRSQQPVNLDADDPASLAQSWLSAE